MLDCYQMDLETFLAAQELCKILGLLKEPDEDETPQEPPPQKLDSYLTANNAPSPPTQSDPPTTKQDGPEITYQLKKINCGKSGCKSCPHGPYWYAYWKDGGKTRSKYIGKKLPDQSSDRALETSKSDESM